MVTFNEIEMLNEIKYTIVEAFKTDTSHESNYWYNLFGKRNMVVYSSYKVSKPTFPCCVLSIQATPNMSMISSSEIDRFSNVIVSIEHYNQAVGDIDRDTLGRMINHRIKSVLQEKYKLNIIYNNEISTNDRTIYRRLIETRNVYDNEKKIFYQGE